MSSEGSITHWLEEIKEGDSDAARMIWERYFPELVRLARQKLRGVPRGMADEEDVALSAIDSFYEAARQGRFPDLADRHDLWRLLLQITARKAIDLARHEKRRRRGGGRVRGESTPTGTAESSSERGLAQVIGNVPTPEFAAMIAEEYRRLLALLEDEDLEKLATAKMEGYRNQEIAERLQCSLRTVERRLQLIRRKWEKGQSP